MTLTSFIGFIADILTLRRAIFTRRRSEKTGNASLTRIDVIKSVIKSSREDWVVTIHSNLYSAHLKNNPDVHVEYSLDNDKMHQLAFRAKWANKHPDPSAWSYWCDLYYRNTIIERFVLVAVDGGRALIPMPDIKGPVYYIRFLPYKIAKVFDSMDTLDEYIKRSGLQIEPG